MIDSLAEVVLQNQGPRCLSHPQGGTCGLLGEECCFCVSKSGEVIQQLEILKKNM